MSSDNIESKKGIALKRWKHLGQMLANRKCRIDGEASSISVRRFASFGLLETHLLVDETDDSNKSAEHKSQKGYLWYAYSCDIAGDKCSALIRYLDGSISIQTLLGFNNTGNVCVWPSEEILTYFCLQRLAHFRDKTVCELGGGMTCLAGVFLGIHSELKELLLTDGNEQSVKNIDWIVKKNRVQFGDTNVNTRVLRWNEHDSLTELEGHFDTVICADCLFFEEFQQDLVDVIWRLLKHQGEAIIFAPLRGQTFDQFKDLALRKFSVTFTSQYDRTILDLHKQNLTKGIEAYDENIHYPVLLQLRKPAAPEVFHEPSPLPSTDNTSCERFDLLQVQPP